MEYVKKQENRGGARPNSGPKAVTLSANQVAKMLREVKKRAKREKKTVMGLLLDFAYNSETGVKDRLASIKLITDLTCVKISEGGEADKALGPSVFLPAQHPRLKVVEGGKSE